MPTGKTCSLECQPTDQLNVAKSYEFKDDKFFSEKETGFNYCLQSSFEMK
jgi:hypothetical protein